MIILTDKKFQEILTRVFNIGHDISKTCFFPSLTFHINLFFFPSILLWLELDATIFNCIFSQAYPIFQRQFYSNLIINLKRYTSPQAEVSIFLINKVPAHPLEKFDKKQELCHFLLSPFSFLLNIFSRKTVNLNLNEKHL